MEKYADRLDAETRRSIVKARADYAEGRDDEADEQGDERKPMRERLLTLDQLANLPPPRPLIAGLLDLDNTGVIYGRRGHYKSFIALDMALCVASGIPWHGHDTTQGVVVYVVAEGVSGVHQRVAAWRHVHPDADPGDRLLILAESVGLLNPANGAELAVTCAEVGAVLVFVDTLARCLVGGDENSSKDVGMAVDTLDLVRRRTGAHVNAVHHSGKDPKAGARGSSALEAAADSVLEVTAAETVVTVNTTKQKNRPEGDPLRFQAVAVLDSVVLQPLGRAAISDDLTRKDIDALLALDAIAGDFGAAFNAWAEAADEVGVSRTSVRRLRKKALETGLIAVGPGGTKNAPRYLLTDDGRAKSAPGGL